MEHIILIIWKKEGSEYKDWDKTSTDIFKKALEILLDNLTRVPPVKDLHDMFHEQFFNCAKIDETTSKQIKNVLDYEFNRNYITLDIINQYINRMKNLQVVITPKGLENLPKIYDIVLAATGTIGENTTITLAGKSVYKNYIESLKTELENCSLPSYARTSRVKEIPKMILSSLNLANARFYYYNLKAYKDAAERAQRDFSNVQIHKVVNSEEFKILMTRILKPEEREYMNYNIRDLNEMSDQNEAMKRFIAVLITMMEAFRRQYPKVLDSEISSDKYGISPTIFEGSNRSTTYYFY